jgi:hypothetical protein
MEVGTFRKFIHVGAVIMVFFLMSGFVSVAGASCGTNPNCIAHKVFVYTTICRFPDACTIHVNSLWDGGPGGDLYFDPGSNLANNILISNPMGGMTFIERINLFGVKSEIIDLYSDINCVPIGDSQTINIFSNSNRIDYAYFDLANNPGLFFAFGGFEIYPDGINQPVTLTRVGENDYEVTGTINVYLKDHFVYTDEEWTDQWAYKCQQAGCIHNFWTRVDMNFIISDLEFQMTSSNMHCDGDPDEIKCCPDGCVNIKTDSDNCGECGNVCTGTTPGCCSGSCKDIDSDPNNCGSCGNKCGANAHCSCGACHCDDDYGNCDGDWSNGCEVNLNTDPNNCGACGNACGANAHCSGGTCHCNEGYGNCDGDWSDGCEVNLNTDPNNCGACGNSCGTNAYCSGGTCHCNEGYGNCDGDWSNGCEVNLNTDPNNCGACSNACDPGETCENGECCGEWEDGCCKVPEGCLSGHLYVPGCKDSGGSFYKGQECCPDGDCHDLNTDPNNCGSYGNSCGANAYCSEGTCQCDEGYGNCDGDWSNGCEVNLNTDPNNCGSCGNVCGANAHCSGGACQCNEGYKNCDGDWSNGCEAECCGSETRSCTTSGCPGTQTCSGGSWGSCAKDDPCCGVTCPDDQWCEEGECVPEASTLVLFAVGLLFLTGYIELKRRKRI